MPYQVAWKPPLAISSGINKRFESRADRSVGLQRPIKFAVPEIPPSDQRANTTATIVQNDGRSLQIRSRIFRRTLGVRVTRFSRVFIIRFLFDLFQPVLDC